jgi:Tfp pilus assembly protein PilF
LRPAAKWYLATCVAFVLGLLSKSMLVTLPLLLLLLDVWPLARWAGLSQTQSFEAGANSTGASQISPNGRTYPPRTSRELLIEKLPLLALSLLDGIVTIIAQPKISMAELPLTERVGNSLVGYGWYVAKTFWPTDLAVLYLHPLTGLAWDKVAAAAVLLAAISIYVSLNGLRRSHLLFGWLWFLIALLPVIGLVQVGKQAYADRYSYIPHLGLLVMIVWEGCYWLDRLPVGRIVAGAAAAVGTAACAWLTVLQVAVWQSADTLFAQALAVDPNNWSVHELVGGLRLETGRLDEAFEHYQLVLKQRPGHSDALSNVAGIYLWRGELSLAERYYRQALAADAVHASAMHNLVALLEQQGRVADAAEYLELYVARRPEDAKMRGVLGRIHIQLGVVQENTGELVAARDHFAAALKLDPADIEARRHLDAVEKRLAGASGR